MELRMVRRLHTDREFIMFTTAQPSFGRIFAATLGTAVFAGICLLGATAPAAAAAPADPRVASIAYSDLNLASASGRKALDNRIVRTAETVCITGTRDLAMRAAEKECVAAVVASARVQTASNAGSN
jgi:UrcA family protein